MRLSASPASHLLGVAVAAAVGRPSLAHPSAARPPAHAASASCDHYKAGQDGVIRTGPFVDATVVVCLDGHRHLFHRNRGVAGLHGGSFHGEAATLEKPGSAVSVTGDHTC